ncbi:uncharacterized protein LOC111360552 [Spodoptera litura]|uniref:Uncharacterized protein LOC111360552 n=1 Tax=Spodoptera litura TaxID=69820 RepID=A0A9J7J133_SPOLT|nr:uncharacterized protein LOC111360552 [Spodoptera litura]
MDLLKHSIYFGVLMVLFFIHYASTERMAHQKDEKSRVWKMPPIVLPPLPKFEQATPSTTASTVTEPTLPPVIQSIIYQLHGSKVLESDEDYELFLKKIKRDFFRTTADQYTTKSHTGKCPLKNKAQ